MDLKSFLKDSGVKQKEFAALVGKTQGYVSRVATGECLLGGPAVLIWAAATKFQVTPHDLRPDIYPKPTDGLPEQTAA
ncbi:MULTISPECIES: YdaS family helix-turn-helix protein [Serratia]|uniref:Transcriptional regulator n=1 Tax=Serratia marcescens TaxID=615 RepID=A0AAP8PJD1_SERMA|nr:MULTISPECIES: YdaS family helix-turn-helix protein [Serratia]ELN4518935.1 helix-turn-helix domain-containing protein [Serratia marcescens]MBF4187664.1 helix-turn-helix domain-containing protein [Serratia ureilytica]MBF8442870.1 helix-turn-helix domain-containing protein [Serratia ureilytica]MBF8447697.1 helix-turn-helix domain-containing protein [Serratia ureilytica]MBH2740768.1 helix-turn-helix domain-containing protein [Serratia marcescens]